MATEVEPVPRRVAALVLAAGRATRFGAGADTSKVLAPWEGRPLIAHVLSTVRASHAAPTIVVTGHAADAVAAAVRAADPSAVLVPNADYRSGLASSLRAGLAAVPEEVDGALVLLADMPGVASPTLDALIARFGQGGTSAVTPTWQGEQGNPVLLGRTLFARVAALAGDNGARKILAAAANVATCAVDDPAILQDVDTPAALHALTSSTGRP